MTKRELLKEYRSLCENKRLDRCNDGIGDNSRKTEIENAIKCALLTDEEINDYLTILKLKYSNIYENVKDKMNSTFCRLYVYDTAKMILTD